MSAKLNAVGAGGCRAHSDFGEYGLTCLSVLGMQRDFFPGALIFSTVSADFEAAARPSMLFFVGRHTGSYFFLMPVDSLRFSAFSARITGFLARSPISVASHHFSWGSHIFVFFQDVHVFLATFADFEGRT